MANSLPGGVLAAIRLPAPSMDAQQQWLSDWRGVQAGSERVQQLLARSMAALNEYKRSLITAAVTGELDVATARPGVPA